MFINLNWSSVFFLSFLSADGDDQEESKTKTHDTFLWKKQKERSLLLILTQSYRNKVSTTQFRNFTANNIKERNKKNHVHSRRIRFNAITISKRKYPVFSALPRRRYATRYVCNCAIPNDSPEPHCYCLPVKGTVYIILCTYVWRRIVLPL